MTERLWRALHAPRDIAALVAFRVAFGVMVCVSALRFLAYGWVDALFGAPFHFKYFGFEWVPALPQSAMHGAFAALALFGALVAAGLFYRAAIALLFVTFTYLQLVDVTAYLNHYYLVSLLALLLCFVPAHRAGSVDVAWRGVARASTLPAWCTWLLRFQVAVVYVFAGLAKLTTDWLLHAQPLNIWLHARTDLPIIGPLFDEVRVAYAAAWFGFLFDTTIVAFLMWRRTRVVAYGVAVLFHAATWVLFPIGMFPLIMTTSALVFFGSSWPRALAARVGRVLGRREPRVAPSAAALEIPARTYRGVAAVAVAGAYALAQIAVPLRTHLYDGDVLWHEQGLRFSWRVMAREKNGSVTFMVRDPATGREWHVPPRRYLNRLQEREMSVQPDLILQLAHRIARDEQTRLQRPVEVRVDAWASLNGRAMARLVDASVDLARERDGFAPKAWLLPAPTTRPPALSPKEVARATTRSAPRPIEPEAKIIATY